MRTRSKRILSTLSLSLLLLACRAGEVEGQQDSSPPAKVESPACPPAGELAASIEQSFRRKVEVKRVQPAAVEGLCEIVVSLRGSASIIYSDRTGRYFLTGQIIDTEVQQDLTREALAEYNRFSPEDMKKLETLTALTLGTGEADFYFVTDPQ